MVLQVHTPANFTHEVQVWAFQHNGSQLAAQNIGTIKSGYPYLVIESHLDRKLWYTHLNGILWLNFGFSIAAILRIAFRAGVLPLNQAALPG